MRRSYARASSGLAGLLVICAWALGGVACGLGAGAGVDGPAGAALPENVVLITVDTLRADALGFAGNDAVDTPALDRLAAGGRTFPDAHAHNVVTLPSHANILTGLYPYQHGVRNNAGFELGEDVATLATVLADEGFATAAFIGAFPLDSRYGLGRGFAVYDDQLGGAGNDLFAYNERPGHEVVARGSRWWQEHEGRRRFLWLHLFDPHAPYEPPEPVASRAPSPYLGEVMAVDSYLAPFLEGFFDGGEAPTVIVFTSDHGEALGEHGELTHGLFAYEPTLRVPLVLWGAGVSPGVDPRPAGHVDLFPTVLDLLGLDAPDGLAGVSLAAPPPQEARTLYFESLSPNLENGWAPLRGVLREGTKWIELPLPELYHLPTDPGESRNLVESEARRARALSRELPEESVWPPAAGAVGAEEAERLRSLGYLGSGAAPLRAAYGPEDDPKKLVELTRKLNTVATLYTAGRADRALEVGREIVEVRPSMTAAYEYLVKILLERRQVAAALDLLHRAEAAGAANDALRQQLGLTLVEAGRPAEAIEVLRRVDPEAAEPDTLNALALALVALGRFDEAAGALERMAAARPDDPRAPESLSFVTLQAGRFADAREHALRALELDPMRSDAWNNLGIAEYEMGRPGEAVAAWQRAAQLDPSNLDVLFNLGTVAVETGEAAVARRALRGFLESAPEQGYAPERARARALLAGLGR